MSDNEEATLNIGALSMATGVPVETIRTWERRYGFPKSQRNEAGHRIYDMETIEELRLITSILAQGYRPSQLEGLSRSELEKLLARMTGVEADDVEDEKCLEEGEAWLGKWLEAACHLQRNRLQNYLHCDLSRMSAVEFLDRRVAPFLDALGQGWASGEIDILHEHFASECLRDFLTGQWRPLSDIAQGRPLILATLSGEQHVLGLHMVALVAAVAGRQIVFVGTDAPVETIAEAVNRREGQWLGISIARGKDARKVVPELQTLRDLVGPDTKILVGGRGAPDVASLERISGGLDQLYDVLVEESGPPVEK